MFKCCRPVVLSVVLTLAVAGVARADGPLVRILFTANAAGYYEPCPT